MFLARMKEHPMHHRETCSTCRTPLRGRRDKRFCDDNCRMKHHRNRAGVLRQIDQILHNNRALIKRFRQSHAQLASDPVASFVWLRRAGYDFNFHTHVAGQADGSLAVMCYEEGFVVEGDGVRLISPQLERPHVEQSVAEPGAAWSDLSQVSRRLASR